MDQPATVRLQPEREVTPTRQESPLPQQQQQQQQVQQQQQQQQRQQQQRQQQLLLQTSNHEPNPQQFLVCRMQPYTPLQQPQQQQQFLALQPVPMNGAFQPQFVPPQPYQFQQQFPPPGCVIEEASPAQPARRYRVKAARTLGWLQICIAITSLVLGIAAIVIYSWGAIVAAPIWTAIFVSTIPKKERSQAEKTHTLSF